MELRVERIPESNFHVSCRCFCVVRLLNEDLDLDPDAETEHHPVQKEKS
jgi:hypothetical protein